MDKVTVQRARGLGCRAVCRVLSCVTLELRKWTHEDLTIMTSFRYIVSSRPAWDTRESVSRKIKVGGGEKERERSSGLSFP